jgi:FkbM family methyltransferase
MPLQTFKVRDVVLEVDSRSLNPPLTAALTEGRYEGSEAHALQVLLRPDDVYFELGAGLGFMSTLAARVVTDPERIHVYEANPELIPVIEKTWAANGVAGNVHHCMLGTGKGEHEFHVSRAFWASSGQIAYGGSRTITVPQRDFLKQLEKRAATFVMMDIEGGERDLLVKKLPSRVRAVVAEYHPHIIGADVVESLWANLESQGFAVAESASDRKVRSYVRET